jgi:AcrR family transcriptional regulator
MDNSVHTDSGETAELRQSPTRGGRNFPSLPEEPLWDMRYLSVGVVFASTERAGMPSVVVAPDAWSTSPWRPRNLSTSASTARGAEMDVMNRIAPGKDRTKVKQGVRKLDPEGTKREILRVARAEFAAKGFSGARIDEIGDRTKTAKRMIYYYFGNKEGLYVAALEEAYGEIRAVERALELDHLSADDALCRLIDFTFDYEQENVEFVRLISSENMNYARYLKDSKKIREVNGNVIETVSKILERGYVDGSFKRKVPPEDIHLMISGLCFYRVSNQYTFSEIFGSDFSSPATSARHKSMIRNAIRSYLRSDEDHD